MNASNIIYNAFLPLFSDKNIKFEEVGTERMPFPSFPLALIKDLLNEAENVFSKDISNVAYIDGDIYVVGDIHGNIRDLIRILATASPPPTSRYLFLGDYVDRGDYSLECIALLLSLSVKYPHHIILLRGNHEYDSVNSTYGFMEQIIALYGQSGVYESFNRVFSYLKIAAIVAGTTLCVHGGLSPHFTKIMQLEDLDRTLNPPCAMLNDIMWSDPSEIVEGIIPSTRGNGCMFGHKFLINFLNNNNLIRLVRGHECVKNGVRVGLDEKIVTVFSSCNYSGEDSNQCGIIKILEDGNFKAFNFPGISILHRDAAVFEKVFYEQKNQKINCMIMSSPSLNMKRNNMGRGGIPLSNSCMKMKTMRAKKFGSQFFFPSDPLPVKKSLPTLVDYLPQVNSNDNCSILSNSNNLDIEQQQKSLNEEEDTNDKISLQNLSTNLHQMRSPQIKKPLRGISKSQSFF